MIREIVKRVAQIATVTNVTSAVLVLLGFAVIWQGLFASDLKDPLFRKRVLALEFAHDQQRVNALATADPADAAVKDYRKELNSQLDQDTAYFIPSYWVYFVFVSAFLYAQFLFDRKAWLFPIPLLISIAALADLHENMSAKSALNEAAGAADIYPAAMVKWICLAVCCIALGIGFLKSQSRIARAAGITSMAGGILIAAFSIFRPQWTDLAFGLIGLSVVLTGIAIPLILSARSNVLALDRDRSFAK